MKTIFKPLRFTAIFMFIISFLMIFFSSCNNEELFAEQATITEDILLQDDTFIVTQDTTVTFDAYANDKNIPENVIFTYTNPMNGTLKIKDNNTPGNKKDDVISYKPNSRFVETDTFEYTICDEAHPENCDTATVTIIVDPIDNVATELKAFPSAYGAGAYITGGRGGTVYHVTNLNNSGTGSLRDAVSGSNRIIVFDVSGVINLTSILASVGNNLTIAGQTAPEGGITIDGGRIYTESSNIIIRYIKFRNGNSSDNGDCLTFNGGSNILVDHCSFSYGLDESLDVSCTDCYMDNITVQNCLFGEAKTGLIVGDSSPKGLGFGSVSVLRNVFVNIGWRFPKVGGEIELDVINNMVHNWTDRLIRTDAYDFSLNLIGNYYQAGSNTINPSAALLHTTWTNNTMAPQIWSYDNYISSDIKPNGYDNDESLAWTKFYTSTIEPKAEWFTSSQLALQGAAPTILTSSSLPSSILPIVGGCHYLNGDGSVGYYRDSLDQGYVTLAMTDSNQVVMSTGSYGDLPNGLPTNTRSSSYDTDNDGMPDAWETATFGDLSRNGTSDFDSDGYTDLEEFLNRVDI